MIQEVSNGTELPREETRTEFLLDLSGDPMSNFPSPLKMQNPAIAKNRSGALRLTSKSSKRRMNLPNVGHKSKRRNWLKKIKREENNDKDRSLAIIRRQLLRKLNEKLKRRRMRRLREKTRRRRSLDQPRDRPSRKINHKKRSKIGRRHDHDIAEKIRIIYGMHHKRGKPSVRHKKSRAKKLKHWRSILPLRAGRHKFHRKSNNRSKRENDRSSDGSLYESIKKIVGRNVAGGPESTLPEVPNFSPNDRALVTKTLPEVRENSRADTSRELTKRLSSSKQPSGLDIGDAKAVSSVESVPLDDGVFYSHMIDLQTKLLKKSNDSTADENYTINGRNPRCLKNCNGICRSKYERVKNLVHAGSHYLLRRFDDCGTCASCGMSGPKKLGETKTKREDRSSSEVKSMAEKILHFASSIDPKRDKSDRVRETSESSLEGLVDKFGIDELGLTSEADRKSLAALVNGIINVQKNVNETLEIIRSGIGKVKTAASSKKTRRKSEKKISKLKSSKKKPTNKRERKKNKKKQKKHKNKGKKKKKSQKSLKTLRNKSKKVKKSVPSRKIHSAKSSSESKKKLENHLDEVGEEIKEILTEESDTKSKFYGNATRNVRSLRRDEEEPAVRKFYARYLRDTEDTNVASLGKFRSRRVRASQWNRLGNFETMRFPRFLDLTNTNLNYSKAKKSPTLVNATTLSAVSTLPTRRSSSSTRRRNKSARSKKQKPRKKPKKHRQHAKKEGAHVDSSFVTTTPKSKKKLTTASTKKSSKGPQYLNLKLTGQVNFIDKTDKNSLKRPSSHFSVQRKLQSSPNMASGKMSKDKSTNKKKNGIKRHASVKKSRILRKSSKRSRRRESQTLVPVENGRIRVKYIYKDAAESPQHRRHKTPKKKSSKTVATKNFREKQKSASPKVSDTRSLNSPKCNSCICDLEESVEELKKILTLKGDSLVKIVEYECKKYLDIGDEIVLVSTGIIGDVLPRSRRDLAEAKGMKYIKPGDLDDVLKEDGTEPRNENDVMSFPGSDLNVPCNRDGEDITWLTSISKPNYTWSRGDGLPLSGILQLYL